MSLSGMSLRPVDKSVLRNVVGVWSRISSEVCACKIVGNRFLCGEPPFDPRVDGDGNSMLTLFGLFNSFTFLKWAVFDCSRLSPIDGGEGDLLCFLRSDGERHREEYPLLQLQEPLSSFPLFALWASSGDPKIPNAEYLVPFGKVTSNVSEGRRDKDQGVTSLSALTEFVELLSVDLIGEGFTALVPKGAGVF